MITNTNVLEAQLGDVPVSKTALKELSIDLTTGLMAFRQAYLQCIAKCWEDEVFAKSLISGPIDANKSDNDWENILSNTNFTDFLPEVMRSPNPENRDGYFPLNWRINLYLIEKIKINETFPLAEYAPYNPKANNGWIGGTDLFLIKIPQKPKGINESELAIALAAYYSNFTTLFGNGYAVTDTAKNEKSNFSSELCEFYKKFRLNYHDYEGAIAHNIPNNLGNGGDESFYGFGAIVMNIISVCWNNPEYLKFITEKNRVITPVGTEHSVINDEYVSFENPWAFNIQFKEVCEGNSKWNSEARKWDTIENNEIYLQFPSKPDVEKHSMRALARYNGTGPAYPLTCP
jgi:ribosomally synthesized peptide (two-chain TOMM family)